MDSLVMLGVFMIVAGIFFLERYKFYYSRRLLLDVYFVAVLNALKFWKNDGKEGYGEPGHAEGIAYSLFHDAFMLELELERPELIDVVLQDLKHEDKDFAPFLSAYRAHRRRIGDPVLV